MVIYLQVQEDMRRAKAAAEAGVPYIYDVIAVDGDNDPLIFKLVRGAAGMAINASTGRLSWWSHPART